MMPRYVRFLITVLLLAICGIPAAGQLEQTRPDSLPSDRNIIAFSNREEARVLSALRDRTPLAEAYFQRFRPDDKLGYIILSDHYILGRFRGCDKPSVEDLRHYQPASAEPVTEKSSPDQRLLDGLLGIMTPDWAQLSPDRYDYTYVGRTFLGAVRCLLYDVKPLKPEEGGFTGRVFVEDRSWNIVRFTGMSPKVDSMLEALRNKNSRFRIDSWRFNISGQRWLPAYAYVEEVAPLDEPESQLVKAQVRFWGYDRSAVRQQQQFVDVLIEQSSSTVPVRNQTWPSPEQSQRLFGNQAEENVLTRLREGSFLGTAGNVEKLLDQVVTNIVVTNHLTLAEPVHCRLILTTPLEAFTVGNTIIFSRGLIDVLPSESAIAMVVAHQLAHNLLGHRRIDTKLAFADVLRISDAELLARLRFRHSRSEELEADKQAMELLAHSPYKGSMNDGGLFMQSLQAHVTQLSSLVQPHFGEHLADLEGVVRNHDIFGVTPVLDPELVTQIAARPLGSMLIASPWNGRLELLKPEPPRAPALRERAEFAVTPFMPFLDYLQPVEKPIASKPRSIVTRRPARRETHGSAPSAKKAAS